MILMDAFLMLTFLMGHFLILMDPFLMLAFLMSHFLIPARSQSGRRITNAEAGPKVCEQLHRKTLGHDSCKLVSRRNVEDVNLPQGTTSQMKWMSISMCLVRRGWTGLAVM